MSEFIWAEKYRPTTLENYIGNEGFKSTIQEYIRTGDIPHLLLHGKQGTGKTTIAKIITSEIDCDVLYINASDENNVDTVRNKIKGFVSTMSYSDLKVVILDEADYITPSAQAALRNLMETFSANSRFILTCNYVERIIDPLVSRTQQFKIYPPSKLDVAKHIANILTMENVTFLVADLKVLVDAHYPDIRKIINESQSASASKELIIDKSNIIESDFKLKLVELLKNNVKSTDTWKKIRQLVVDSDVRDFAETYSFLYEKVAEYSSAAGIASNILAIAEGQYRDAVVVDKEINFMAVIINILK